MGTLKNSTRASLPNVTILVVEFRIEVQNALTFDISLVTLLKSGFTTDALPAILKILTGKFAVGSFFS